MPRKTTYQKVISKIQNLPLDAKCLEDLESQMGVVMDYIKELRDCQQDARENMPYQFQSAPGSGAVLWERYESLDNCIYAFEDIDFVYDVTEDEPMEDRMEEIRNTIRLYLRNL